MNLPKPTAVATPAALPPGHPLEAKLASWVKLRDELNELLAQLEYAKLMLKIEQRKA